MAKELIDKIEREEGVVLRMYKCPADYWTIGAGINLEQQEMPAAVARYWLELILHDLSRQLKRHSWFLELDEARRIVITDMAYQMGVNGLMAFGQMIAAIKRKDWEEAARQMLDSKYAKHDSPNRANRNAEVMRMGKL